MTYTQDVGCTGIPSPSGDTGVYIPAATIHNNGTNNEGSFGARFYATGPGATYDNTITGLHLRPGHDTTVVFPSWHITVRGSWAMKCSTQLTGDQVQSNDKCAETRGINNSIKVLMAGTEGDIAALRALIVSNSGGLISAVDYFAAASSSLLPHARTRRATGQS